eukprot:UN11417
MSKFFKFPKSFFIITSQNNLMSLKKIQFYFKRDAYQD